MTIFDDIHRNFQELFGISISGTHYTYLDTRDLLSKATTPDDFITELTESGAQRKLIYLRKQISKPEFDKQLGNPEFPFLFFTRNDDGMKVIMVKKDKKKTQHKTHFF